MILRATLDFAVTMSVYALLPSSMTRMVLRIGPRLPGRLDWLAFLLVPRDLALPSVPELAAAQGGRDAFLSRLIWPGTSELVGPPVAALVSFWFWLFVPGCRLSRVLLLSGPGGWVARRMTPMAPVCAVIGILGLPVPYLPAVSAHQCGGR